MTAAYPQQDGFNSGIGSIQTIQNTFTTNIQNQGDLGTKMLNAKNFIKYILHMISEIQDNFTKEYKAASDSQYVIPPPEISELRLKLMGAFEKLEKVPDEQNQTGNLLNIL